MSEAKIYAHDAHCNTIHKAGPEECPPQLPPGDDPIVVPKELLQYLFDIAVGSMDFGSDFLGDDEVTALRQTADLLGVDPMLGTPDKYRRRIAHTFVPYVWGPDKQIFPDRCDWCTLPPTAEVHR